MEQGSNPIEGNNRSSKKRAATTTAAAALFIIAAFILVFYAGASPQPTAGPRPTPRATGSISIGTDAKSIPYHREERKATSLPPRDTAANGNSKVIAKEAAPEIPSESVGITENIATLRPQKPHPSAESDDSAAASRKGVRNSLPKVRTVPPPDGVRFATLASGERVEIVDSDGDYIDYPTMKDYLKRKNAANEGTASSSSSSDGTNNNRDVSALSSATASWEPLQCSDLGSLDAVDYNAQCDRSPTANISKWKRLPRRYCEMFAIYEKEAEAYRQAMNAATPPAVPLHRPMPPCGHVATGAFKDAPLRPQQLLETLMATKAARRTAGDSSGPTATGNFFSRRLNPSNAVMDTIDVPSKAAPAGYPFELRLKHSGGERGGGGGSGGKAASPSPFQYMSPLEATAVLYQTAFRHNLSQYDAASSSASLPETAFRGGRGILFTGDSMTRQLFLSLVAHLRGQRDVSEYYFHTDALYVMYPSSDSLEVLTPERKRQYCGLLKRWFPGYNPLASPDSSGKEKKKAKRAANGKGGNANNKCHDTHRGAVGGERDPLLVLLYIWDVTPLIPRTDVLPMREVPVQIDSYMYWWYGTRNTSLVGQGIGVPNAPMNVPIDPYLERVAESLAADPMRRYVWMTTPLVTEQNRLTKVFGELGERNARMVRWVRHGTPYAKERGGGEVKAEDALAIEGEDTLLRNFTEDEYPAWVFEDTAPATLSPSPPSSSSSSSSSSQQQKYILDLAGIADVARLGGVLAREDGSHFTCTWTPAVPQAITGYNGNAHACRDPFNTAAAQWLLHLLLNM